MPVDLNTIEVQKTCGKCQEQYPADQEFFFRDKRSADGLRSICKACYYELPSVLNRKQGGHAHAR